MPRASVTYYGGTQEQLLAVNIANELARLLLDRTKSVVTVDVLRAERHVITAPSGVIANEDIVHVTVQHGGELLSKEDQEHIGRELTAKFSDWKCLLAFDKMSPWFANGVYV